MSVPPFFSAALVFFDRVSMMDSCLLDHLFPIPLQASILIGELSANSFRLFLINFSRTNAVMVTATAYLSSYLSQDMKVLAFY